VEWLNVFPNAGIQLHATQWQELLITLEVKIYEISKTAKTTYDPVYVSVQMGTWYNHR